MSADARQVERLRGLLAAATPGEWEAMRSGAVASTLPGSAIMETVAHTFPTGDGPKHNAALIAEAITAMPDLLATAEAHAALVKAVEGLLNEWEVLGGSSIGESRAIREHSTDLRAILAATDTAADRGAR